MEDIARRSFEVDDLEIISKITAEDAKERRGPTVAISSAFLRVLCGEMPFLTGYYRGRVLYW
jgi:hypothetical protein